MAIQNVTADFVRRAAQANSARHTPEQLVNMRIHGVMPDQSTGPPGGKSQN